jgi:TrmH family RNA methyltransferase
MISKNRIRFIKSLELKKNRLNEQLFVIEGEKMVHEAIEWIPDFIDSIYTTSELNLNYNNQNIKIEYITENELKLISSLKTPNKAIAICKFLPQKEPFSNYIIALDGIQDPGNMGTILRMADWFGISHIICSTDTVDVYNPKVLQATMGAIFRVSVIYTSLDTFFSENTKPVYGALLEGKNIFKESFEKEGVILLGNEGKGIRNETLKYINQAITIPRFGHAESLNVATAGAIILGSIFREN